jgi:hypothetical protein
MTRHEVVSWKDAWDDLDRARVANALDAMPDWAEAWIPSSRSYIGVWVYGSLRSRDWPFPFGGGGFVHERWHRGLVVRPGSLEWPGGMWCDGLDEDLFPVLEEGDRVTYGYLDYYRWFPLSTRGRSGRRGPRADPPTVRLCPVHHVQLPATGVCDFC